MMNMPPRLTLLDGGLGTTLAARGLDTRGPLFSAAALLEESAREALIAAHRDFALAGAEVLTAATFRTARRSLARAGMADRFPRLAIEAVRAAREGAARARQARGETREPGADHPGDALRTTGAANVHIRVAGSLAPLEDCYRPGLSPPREAALAEHREHAQVLAGAGCDLLLVETICAAPEGLAAIEAAAGTGLPVWAAVQVSPRGTLLDGSELRAFLLEAPRRGASALLFNCTPCDGIDGAIGTLAACGARAGCETGAYAQLGELDPASGWPDSPALSPPGYAARAKRWLDAGATVLGGCCGAGPSHIAALARLRCAPGER